MMKNNKGKGLIAWGLLLIAAALSLTGYNLYDGYRAERSAREAVSSLEVLTPAETALGPENDPTGKETEIPDYILNPNMEMPAEHINGVDYIGILRIPALDLELPVISEWSYPHLKIAPCRYTGSAYTGDLIIAAHNYSAHFGKLNALHEGDTATFTDMDGNVFTYQMAERETLQPTSVDEMESGDWDLTLFTCTVGGQSRITLRFVLT